MASGFNPFGGSASSKVFREWCECRDRPFSLFRYGKLSGGVMGKEPVPFIGLPALEPELHPSYKLKSCVLTRPFNNLFTVSDDDICTRDTLAEAIVQSISLEESVEGKFSVQRGVSSASLSGRRAFSVSQLMGQPNCCD